jgi:hypothetical protein
MKSLLTLLAIAIGVAAIALWGWMTHPVPSIAVDRRRVSNLPISRHTSSTLRECAEIRRWLLEVPAISCCAAAPGNAAPQRHNGLITFQPLRRRN